MFVDFTFLQINGQLLIEKFLDLDGVPLTSIRFSHLISMDYTVDMTNSILCDLNSGHILRYLPHLVRDVSGCRVKIGVLLVSLQTFILGFHWSVFFLFTIPVMWYVNCTTYCEVKRSGCIVCRVSVWFQIRFFLTMFGVSSLTFTGRGWIKIWSIFKQFAQILTNVSMYFDIKKCSCIVKLQGWSNWGTKAISG